MGLGAYRSEGGETKLGYNLGAGIMWCLKPRLSLSGRYDYRRVNGFERAYSTVTIGLRWSF